MINQLVDELSERMHIVVKKVEKVQSGEHAQGARIYTNNGGMDEEGFYGAVTVVSKPGTDEVLCAYAGSHPLLRQDNSSMFLTDSVNTPVNCHQPIELMVTAVGAIPRYQTLDTNTMSEAALLLNRVLPDKYKMNMNIIHQSVRKSSDPIVGH